MELIRRFARRLGGGDVAASGAAADEKTVAGEGEGALVEAARRGDRGAFDRLVGAYRAQLRGFLLRRVGSEAVDDLMQEVWVASWLAMPRFQRRACFRTYLYSIAVNKCMDHHRAQSRAAAALGTGGAANGDAEGGLPEGASFTTEQSSSRMRSPEELYAAAELRETVRRLIDRLPPAQREVLDLYYYAELTLPEIASVLKRNLNTVKYQFYRAHDLVGQGLTQIEGGLYEMPAAASSAAASSAAASAGKTSTAGIATAKAKTAK